jgi:class III poly(R)-hydroxyalkanoic acid synthase PhaE subunit
MAGFNEMTEAWSKVWMDAQKQYLDSWMQLSQQGGQWPGIQAPFAPGGAGTWTEPMQQWSRLMAQALPQGSQQASSRLFDLGKSYLSMGETFWRLLQQEGKEFAGQESDWMEAIRKTFGAACKLPAGAGAETDPWSGFATFWGLPVKTWQRFACSFSPFPGELGKALRPEDGAVPSDVTRAVRQMLSMPPVGYTREWQEQAQEWVQLYIEYAKAVQEFAQLLGKVSQRATELFGQKLSGQLKEGKPLEGLRAAYNLWIDCGEEAYGEVVATPDFPHLQAQMVNALMRLKRHEQAMMDETMTAMNMPTRRELDTTHKRVHGLQRQLSALQDALEDITPAEAQASEQRPAARTAPAARKAAPRAARNPAKRRVQPKKKR